MGARQSVAQPTRQRASAADGGPSSSASGGAQCTNGHTLGDQSAARDSGGYRAGSSLVFQSSAPSTSQQTSRSRQARSRSVTVPSPDFVRSASLSTPLSSNEPSHQSHAHRHQPHFRSHQPILLRDQSSDSSGGGADNDGSSITTGIPSLDRLLRLNSALVVGGTPAAAAGSTSGATAVWLPPVAYRQCDVKCPVCRKTIPSDDVEYHLVVCLTRPRIAYNEDVLTEDKGECVICFEEMSQGDTIARLPCLCVYHKMCIDSWFKVKNCCPEHPGDD